MMEDLWTLFCGEADCSENKGKPCSSSFVSVSQPSSCINEALVICFTILLLSIFLFTMVRKASLRMINIPACFQGFSPLQIISAIVNGGLGFLYLCLGIYSFVEKLRKTHTFLPLHLWMEALFQGFTWLLVGLAASLWGKHLPKAPLQLLCLATFLFAGTHCSLSIFAAIVSGEISVMTIFDALSFLGSILLLSCAYKGSKDEDSEHTINCRALYAPLKDETSNRGKIDYVTPFATAGLFSRMSFWWLNPLMKKGRGKTLVDKDIPKLREIDQAESCYSQFLEQFNRQKQTESSSQPSILRTIVLCHWKEIFVSGFFALIKILTVSAGPLLLIAFIEVAEGKEDFKYQGHVLATSLFFAKIIESLSERQWCFRSRLIGLKVRSFITAAIYKKQLKLSNAAKMKYSVGEIMNYVNVDAYRIGELPFWFHQTWTSSLQLCIALTILFRAVGLATIAALLMIILTVICNIPLAKLQHKFQTKLMAAQDKRLKASSEALVHMKVMKLYAWEIHFKNVIENLREVEYKWLSAVQLQKAYNGFIFWSSPVLVSAATFGACYLLNVPLYAANVFTFVATLRLVQEPVRSIPDVIASIIQAKVAFTRIVRFLEAPELQSANEQQNCNVKNINSSILIESAIFSWDENISMPTLRNLSLEVRPGEKVAVCGEVGSGKSTLLAAILQEVPNIQGIIQVSGKIAYVSQSAWIQTGTIQENILFGSTMDAQRYEETIERCSLAKDLELLPFGDLTEIGERGVNLSGGQKQRIQLARALYQDADIYLLDDPFSAVDAHTATSLFNEYIMGALSRKTVLLVTHQVDFLPAFESVLWMSNGQILLAAPYHQLLASSQEFQDFINAHKETVGSERHSGVTSEYRHKTSAVEIKTTHNIVHSSKASIDHQLIKQEERETGNTGFKPYILYLNQKKGLLFFSMASICHLIFVLGQISQNFWMATSIENRNVSSLELIVVYLLIGLASTAFLLFRSFCLVALGLQSSKSLFSKLLNSLFRAPMSFYDSTPLGRILSRVSSDMSIVDLDVLFSIIYTAASTINAFVNLGVIAVVTWQVLFVSIPMVFLVTHLQRYYLASAKELMRINGTTKSMVANHIAESVAGAMTIRAFKEEHQFFVKNLNLIDTNAGSLFHSFAANEWLILRLAALCAVVLSSSAFCMILLPPGTFSSGFVGMALSYGLSLNISIVFSIQNQCTLANYIISVERLNQCMHIPSEALEVIEGHHPPQNWPVVGKVEIHDLQIRYRPNAPLVLRGITCTFEGGHKIGIVGRTGCGKTTLISALFRLIEPAGGKITVDGLNISTIGLHDLRSRFGIIPQDPTLFNGTVRYNLDPLSRHSEQEIWEVLRKCQLQDAVKEKKEGLNSLVMEEGWNWSMGQRQLFCLGRALLKRSQILVLDEATASIDNATDLILQKTIRSEFTDCTVITVAHRIPTVMDCTMVLAIDAGQLVEYDEPTKLMMREDSLFRRLVKEYWSHFHSADSH
ncbi:ABC transporter C family member 10-like [Malania oleifera]|uniref:ABC transporter C family member 10-like n=1 Tax=Malania oleifera TaxID=397392 RepID=UPI0025AE6AEC|nr:ABC transporter C family member 10-like [Malania oleifera]